MAATFAILILCFSFFDTLSVRKKCACAAQRFVRKLRSIAVVQPVCVLFRVPWTFKARAQVVRDAKRCQHGRQCKRYCAVR